MKKILLFVISIITCFSCTKSVKVHPVTESLMASDMMQISYDSTITVIDHEKAVILPFEDFNARIKDIQYIPFFSREPIGGVDRLIIFDKYVIVLDAFKSESIFIFDLSGKLINVIHSKGGGPKEYHALFDICIDRRDSLIVLDDRLAPFKLFFTLEGQFVKKIRSIPCSYFEIFNDKIIGLLGFGQSYSREIHENYLIGVSINDSILYKGFPYYPLQVQAVNYRGLQYNYKDELLFKPNLSDTVYQFLNDSTLFVKYVVNQKKSVWEKRDENLSSTEYHSLVKESHYTFLTPPILETEKFLAYRISHGLFNNATNRVQVAEMIFWYEKDKKQSFSYTMENLKSFPYIPNHVPQPIAIWGNYFVGLTFPYEIDMMRETIQKHGVIINEKLNRIIMAEKNEDLEFILVLYELQ